MDLEMSDAYEQMPDAFKAAIPKTHPHLITYFDILRTQCGDGYRTVRVLDVYRNWKTYDANQITMYVSEPRKVLAHVFG